MPSPYSESSTWVSPVQGPDNTELADESSVDVPFQALVSRSKYLYDIIGPTGTGTKRVHMVANRTALKAETGQQDGDVIGLLNGEGFYVFSASSALTEDLPWVVTPTAGGGRWLHMLRGLKGAASGLASLSALGKVVEPVPYALIGAAQYATALTTQAYHSTSTTYADVDSGVARVTVSTVAGDFVTIDATCELGVEETAGFIAFCRLAVVDGGTTYGLDETMRRIEAVSATAAIVPVSMHTLWVAVTTGVLTVKIQAKSANVLYNANVNRPIVIRARVERP